MQLNIRSAAPGGPPVSFSGEADLSRVRCWGQAPFPFPVSLAGELFWRHGQTVLRYTVRYTLHLPCARCLADVSRAGEECFEHIVAEHLSDGDPEDWAHAPDGLLELGAVAEADLVLALDTAPLCGENCLGLCPHCGTNRNRFCCDCAKKLPPDSPFAALLESVEHIPPPEEGS